MTVYYNIRDKRVQEIINFCAQAAKTQILLGSYLNTTIDYFDIKKVRKNKIK